MKIIFFLVVAIHIGFAEQINHWTCSDVPHSVSLVGKQDQIPSHQQTCVSFRGTVPRNYVYRNIGASFIDADGRKNNIIFTSHGSNRGKTTDYIMIHACRDFIQEDLNVEIYFSSKDCDISTKSCEKEKFSVGCSPMSYSSKNSK